MLCYVVMLCYVMLCYVMLCYVMLCYVMLCYVHFLVTHFNENTKTFSINNKLTLIVARSPRTFSLIPCSTCN